jgi:hypothetical protein
MTKPQRPEKNITKKRRPSWAHEIIRDVEKYGSPDGFSEKARNLDHILVTWHCYVISLMLSLRVMKRMQRRKYGRMP